MLRFPSPAAMEIMALAGVDLVIIDNEHYPFDEETMIDLVRAADVRGMACAVRVPNAEPTRIAQIMDYGVDGILVPSVDSYEEAMQLVNAVKYAPVGERGFCPITPVSSTHLVRPEFKAPAHAAPGEGQGDHGPGPGLSHGLQGGGGGPHGQGAGRCV